MTDGGVRGKPTDYLESLNWTGLTNGGDERWRVGVWEVWQKGCSDGEGGKENGLRIFIFKTPPRHRVTRRSLFSFKTRNFTYVLNGQWRTGFGRTTMTTHRSTSVSLECAEDFQFLDPRRVDLPTLSPRVLHRFYGRFRRQRLPNWTAPKRRSE